MTELQEWTFLQLLLFCERKVALMETVELVVTYDFLHMVLVY